MAVHDIVDGVLAPVKYIKWQPIYETERPFYCFVDIPRDASDQRTTNIVYEDRQTFFHNIRGREQEFSLDRNGFAVVKHDNLHFDAWEDEALVEANYLPEVEKLIRAHVPGADKIHFFDWRLRNTKLARTGTAIDLARPTDWLRPALHAHIDQAPSSAVKRTYMHLPEEASQLLRGRVRIINVWRPLRNPVQDWPLGLCDGTTAGAEDLIETDHLRRGYAGVNMNLQYQEGQRWYYLKNQARDEVLMFKNFDSESSVDAKYCPHVAFNDSTAECVFQRESIEVRALVYTLV